MHPYVFTLKENGAVTEREQDFGVATEKPSITTEAQLGGSSSAVV